MQFHANNLFDRIELKNLLAMEWSEAHAHSSAVADGPVLSISPVGGTSRERGFSAHPRLMRLHLDGDQLAGDVRCSNLDLPFENECLQLIVARHVIDAVGLDCGLHDELLRVLAPGGLLLLFGFNPISSWRLWWLREALHDMPMPCWKSAEQMRRRLTGSECMSCKRDYLGGAWPTNDCVATPMPSRPWHGVWMISARKQRAAARPISVRPQRKRVIMNPELAQLSRRLTRS